MTKISELNLPYFHPYVYVVIALCIGYLIINYTIQLIRYKRLVRNISITKKKYDEIVHENKQNKTKLIDAIGDIYGNKYANLISIGDMWEGMPANLLLLSKGRADNIKQTVDTNSVIQYWRYSTKDSKGHIKKNLLITIKNNIVVSWSEEE